MFFCAGVGAGGGPGTAAAAGVDDLGADAVVHPLQIATVPTNANRSRKIRTRTGLVMPENSAGTPSKGKNLIAARREVRLNFLRDFCQGPWNVDLRTPPGPEGSNGSLLCIRRGHPGTPFECGMRNAECGMRSAECGMRDDIRKMTE